MKDTIFTGNVIPLSNGGKDGTSSNREFFKKGCSSNLAAVGLSAGFLLKQQRKKSLPSGESVSGMGGVSFITLNMAAACINKQQQLGNTFLIRAKFMIKFPKVKNLFLISHAVLFSLRFLSV